MSSIRHRPLQRLTIALILLIGSPAPQAQSDLESWVTFGRIGKLFTNFKPIAHWPKLLARYRAEEERDARCREARGGRCPYREWRSLIERLRGQGRLTQVEEVNRFVNRWPYILT